MVAQPYRYPQWLPNKGNEKNEAKNTENQKKKLEKKTPPTGRRARAHPWQCQTLVKAPGILTSTVSRTGNCLPGLGSAAAAPAQPSSEQPLKFRKSIIGKMVEKKMCAQLPWPCYFFFWHVWGSELEGSWLWGCSRLFANISITFFNIHKFCCINAESKWATDLIF